MRRRIPERRTHGARTGSLAKELSVAREPVHATCPPKPAVDPACCCGLCGPYVCGRMELFPPSRFDKCFAVAAGSLLAQNSRVVAADQIQN